MINDTESSSTCEMITDLVEYYDIDVDPYYATILLAGIVLDTSNFMLKTKAETYYAAYYLSSLGASAKKVQYLLKQDTHWNDFGAYVGYKAISQIIAKDSEINYNFEVQFPEEKLSDLDLIQMSGIKDILKDVEPKVIYQEDVEFTGMVLQTETIFGVNRFRF